MNVKVALQVEDGYTSLVINAAAVPSDAGPSEVLTLVSDLVWSMLKAVEPEGSE